MTTKRRAAGPVDFEQADAALLEVATRLRSAREAIADLLAMENARTDDLHADDDYIRRVVRSVQDRRRKLLRDRLKTIQSKA